MKPDAVYFSDHARDRIHEINQRAGVFNPSIDWVYGRVRAGHGVLFQKGDSPRYELYCPDKDDIAIHYGVEVENFEKKATIVTVMVVSNPPRRYSHDVWERIDT